MDKVKTFYNFEKIEERWQKKLKKIIAHNVFGLGEVAEPKSQIEKLNLIIKNKC